MRQGKDETVIKVRAVSWWTWKKTALLGLIFMWFVGAFIAGSEDSQPPPGGWTAWFLIYSPLLALPLGYTARFVWKLFLFFR